MDRSNVLTYSNVKQMYVEVYDCTVNACVINDYCEGYPSLIKIRYHITYCEMCLAVDKAGSTSPQRGDGHIGGLKYLSEQGTVPQI